MRRALVGEFQALFSHLVVTAHKANARHQLSLFKAVQLPWRPRRQQRYKEISSWVREWSSSDIGEGRGGRERRRMRTNGYSDFQIEREIRKDGRNRKKLHRSDWLVIFWFLGSGGREETRMSRTKGTEGWLQGQREGRVINGIGRCFFIMSFQLKLKFSSRSTSLAHWTS